jgi:hypothetical protein
MRIGAREEKPGELLPNRGMRLARDREGEVLEHQLRCTELDLVA